MDISQRHPEVEARLVALADAANTADGKINLLGEFDVLWAGQVPCLWPALTFVAKLRWRFSYEGPQALQLLILDEDEHLVAAPVDLRLARGKPRLKDTEDGAVIIVTVRMAQFREYGTYRFTVVADGKFVCSAPLHVAKPPAATP